jgi:nucleotide-binding universal stress UspA family protein
MFKVLIAVDGSPSTERALALTTALLSGKEVEARLLHVIPRHLIFGGRGPVVAESYDLEQVRRDCQAFLATCAQRLQQEGVGPHIKTELAAGDPADIILAAAEKDQTDLIILGRRGLNAMQRFLQGSVSTKVVAQAPCAVLVADSPDGATSSGP